jgi:hypothetical protein
MLEARCNGKKNEKMNAKIQISAPTMTEMHMVRHKTGTLLFVLATILLNVPLKDGWNVYGAPKSAGLMRPPNLYVGQSSPKLAFPPQTY